MYNNDPQYMNPQQGLASLVNSPYGDSDVMRVKMTPREVAGLQQLAISHGATEQDLYDPVTGEPRFSFLKKILPMVAGAFLGPGGAGIFKTSLGAATAVGLGYGLIEGDLKKGLMAGLGAYSGSNLVGALRAAADVGVTPEPSSAVSTSVAPTAQITGAPSVKDTILGGPVKRTFDTTGAANWAASNTPPAGAAVAQAGTTVKPPDGILSTLGRGVSNIFGSKEGSQAFMDALGNPISRYATFAGAAIPFTEEPKPINVPGMGEDIVYIPGGFNPQYGTGADQPAQLQGRYYKRTSKGLVPYNPYAPGYASGGYVDVLEEGSLPQREVMPYPVPNQNYPLSTVVRANYSPATPRPREVVGGYGPKMDPFTGEEKFADGGEVEERPQYYEPSARPDFFSGRIPPPTPTTPFAAGQGPDGRDQIDYVTAPTGILPQETTPFATTTQQQASVDPNVEANRKYVEELNRRALNPVVNPYGLNYAGGLGGTNKPWTGTNPYGGPLTPPTTGGQTTTGGDSAAQTAAFLATQIGINWMMQPGNAAALQKWITGGMKWADRPFLNADKAGTGTGTGTGTGQGQGQTGQGQGQTGQGQGQTGQGQGQTGQGQGQTQTGGEGQTTTGAEKPPVFDPVKGIVIAGGTSAAAIAAAKALAAKQGIASVGVYALDGTLIANVAGGAGAAGAATGAAGAAGAATGTGAATTGATGAATGTTGAATTGATGAGTQTGIASTLKGGATAAGTAAAAAAALIGAHQAYQGISKGREGQAAAGGALAGAGGAYLAGASGLGGAGLTSLAGFGPVGLAAAALAAIGASMVNTKEYGDVALRNYWNAVDKGRGIGQTDPNELAQGFINFYRTNKNEFAGQEKYGRTGNEDFVYDMTQVINNAVKDGKVNKDVDAATMYKEVVQPWLNSMGSGPKDEKARSIQDFMMTDLINSFMQGKPISNAQVKGDKKFKIVSERPVYAGVPTTQQQTPASEDDAVRQAIEAYGMQGGFPAGMNPFGQIMPFAEGGSIGEDYNFGFAMGGMPEYKAGGKLLDGPGDGMSDSIPAVIRGKGVQRAALADGEFVVPADVVSHLGNGSTKAGAKKLYAMMDKVRQARTGSKRQAPAVKSDRFLPA